MKEKNYIFTWFVFHYLVLLLKQVQTLCPTVIAGSGYVNLLYGTVQYCAKCDTSCSTCSNEGLNNCITCPADFTFDPITSYCIPPNTKQINTLESSYKFAGFSPVPGWDGGASVQHATYKTTVYGTATSAQLFKSFTLDPAHYQLRILVSLWITESTSSITDWIQIQVTLSGTAATVSTIVPGGLAVTNMADPAVAGYPIYPTGWRAKNVDTTFPDSTHDVARIGFTSNRNNFGIREFIFIQYLCNKTACSRCNTNANTSCLECTQAPIRAIQAGYPNLCLCNSTNGYFKHPDWDFCVSPCPNRVEGQYYGDNDTKNCVLSCSNTSHLADPSVGLCVTTCNATITLGNLARLLYIDTRNKKCVTVCPSTEPYFNTADRTCYSTCPGGKFKNDRNMQCVTTCPDVGIIPLFGENGRCVEECIGADNWGDPVSHLCTSNCFSNTTVKYFQDNSTGRNLCTNVCPYPQRFGDDITDPAQPYCDDVCPSGKYGDFLSPRRCVSVCAQDTTVPANIINYYGLKVQTRQCVKICPEGSWGQKTSYTCVLAAADCQHDTAVEVGGKYADNHTWTCVPRGKCAKGRYSDDISKSCVISCPSGRFANDATRHCQTGCPTDWFGDPGLNRCVQVCQSTDINNNILYSDVSSGNMCVAECNQAGTTPFRDLTTRKCVDKCPIDKKLFADPIAKSCVYNCTINTYAYDNSPTSNNKTCEAICPSPYFADNSTGYGLCVLRCPCSQNCPEDPIFFGDIVAGKRLCVSVCQPAMFGDQNPANGRLCRNPCPAGWFAQDDTLRRCVTRCNSTTYGDNLVCKLPANCPTDWVGDPFTNLCVQMCPASQGTFSDLASTRTCVKQCPILSGVIYFADPTKRWCVTTCNASHLLFGNNLTRTCELKCIDPDSWADAQHTNRFCHSNCTDPVDAVTSVVTLYYRNNFTKVCVISTQCPTNYFGDNSTDFCVKYCPIVTSQQTWGHVSTQTCVNQCYGNLWGDTSTGVPLCIVKCPELPAKWSYNPTMICVTMCPLNDNLYGEDFNRTCVLTCPNVTTAAYQTFHYDPTRRCLKDCPETYFADYTTGRCYPTPQQCTYGWGDDFNNSCVHNCTGPTPWDSFGDNTTRRCTIFCTQGLYADPFTGTRQCVPVCPGIYDIYGNKTGTHDSFGDNENNRCETFCMTPGFFADWHTHRCQPRCSGDTFVEATATSSTKRPTYANNVNKRCVIAVACPEVPDKLYADNRTRKCTEKCFTDGTVTQWADNLTRSCIPQCYHINDTSKYPYDTRFYGDISTNVPHCIITCPTSPRLFGNNITNKCVLLCDLGTFGDPNNNRSCTADCYEWNLVIHYSQDDGRICVPYCKDGTFASWHNRHCQTDPKDCVAGEYGSDFNNSCVALCPQARDYFGDNSTKLCVKKCPNLTELINNVPTPYHSYADYTNRLCVRKCNATAGKQGTFGDNFTNTCVQRCPSGSFGDPLTVNRHCVATCTNSNFADPLSMLCVIRCPASPPSFGFQSNWTCLRSCPTGTWADSYSRKCVATCPTNATVALNTYRLTSFTRQCTSKCPSNPDLYADDESDNCQSVCTAGQFADPDDRKCKASCLPKFQYNFRCVSLCPDGYYANPAGDCVIPSLCGSTLPYAENRTTKCVATCTGGSFADTNSKYCIAVCPDGWYGDVNTCRQTCQTSGTSASNITQTCVSNCPNLTYAEDGVCKANCTTGYNNDALKTCHTSCPQTPIKLFANPVNKDCVQVCDSGYVRNQVSGFCVLNANGCPAPPNIEFSDPITGNCQTKCSTGYWGNQANRSCLTSCVTGEYGYETATQRTCYLPLSVPAAGFYADPVSKKFVSVCPTTPKLYFADRNLKQCVQVCQPFSSTQYYGDPQTRQCQSVCQNATFYTADRATDRCTLKCTLGTFRFNNTANPICRAICPEGYADPTTRVCIGVCPVHADTYGFHNQTSTEQICVSRCPTGFYANPDTRVCNRTCVSPYYADNRTNRCVNYCIDSFADDNNRICMDVCYSNSYPSADNSTNKCVLRCPAVPDYYNQNKVCKFYCQTTGFFADPTTRQCVSRCPNVAANVSVPTAYVSYGDQTNGRCVKKCPEEYWGDNSTNKCVKRCSVDSYADNLTRVCVLECPRNESIYADTFTRMCSFTCSNGYFGSQVSQKCIETCDNGGTEATKYWGDPLTTLCVNVCPSTTYSYGQNVTRKCVASCNPYTTYGFADNFSRICRGKCQDTIVPETYADPTTHSCVQICPQGRYMENSTNQCVQVCLTGIADNYSRYCVLKCPDDPETFGQFNSLGHPICMYECLGLKFSNNHTNMCDVKCPTTPDFFGDPHLGRCVHFCTEGSYAQNNSRQCIQKCPVGEYADNLTRKCVQLCPNATQGTYRDTTTQKCVRVCPDLWWAENTSAICVNDCPSYSANVHSYEDNISKFCVAQCPFPYYGKNDTHNCVLECSAARDLYGHNEGRVCVTRLGCYHVTGKQYYADEVSGTCVQVCPQTLWAEDVTWTCVSNCDPVNAVNKLLYRNHNNQKCVPLCPSNPDEYADDSTGNCVRKCPPGSYAHSYSGFRKCVASCTSYSLFADNTTNRCVSKCPTDPFMFADTTGHRCVYQCKDSNKFADNKTQTCVTQCPADWQLWGERLQYTCVQLCPDGYFADVLSNRECNQQCTSPRFADKWTSTCVVHCSQIRQNYYKDLSTGTGVCVQVCPGDSFGYNGDQACKPKQAVTLYSTCPTLFYADRDSKLCVKQCPAGTFADQTTRYCEVRCTGSYYADPATRKCLTGCSPNYFGHVFSSTNNTCLQFCPATYYALNSTLKCVSQCASLYQLDATRSCQTSCPEPFFKYSYSGVKDCRTNCTPLFADRAQRQCLGTCVSPDFANPLKYTCDLFCPLGYYGRTAGRVCATTCLSGTFADPSTRLCLPVCPEYPLLFADSLLHQCVQVCQTGYGQEISRTCVATCPNITINSTHKTIYLADRSNRLCVLHCTNRLVSFADYSNNECTQRCPDGTFGNNFTKQCVPQCPTVPNDTFAQNTSHICMKQCPIGSYGSSQNLYCVDQCWWPNFADDTTGLCLQTCPLGYFAQNQTARCTKKCDSNTYADPTTRRCVKDCPIMHELFKYDEDSICVSQCPPDFYADDTTRKCKRRCAEQGMYAYELTRECVRECPVPYRAYDVNNTCIQACPELYFYNITRNKCTKCPVECLVCTDPTSCLKCATGYNLFNGICDISCQPNNGIITYSDPQGICVRICPFSFFGDNSSYACVKTCPLRQFGSTETQLCQNCPETCAQCSSMTNCSACESGATLASDLMCYRDCNNTHKFYWNNTCFTVCPEGTFLTFTNVHCAACSANCKTCTENATRCLTCEGKYFYEFSCLTKCPEKWFGNKQFSCQECTNDTNEFCAKPLTFTTRMAIENFVYVLYLKFNQGVDIKKQIEDVIKVKLKVRRLMQATTDMINNGISYTYEILPDQTIKLFLIIQANLVSPQFSIEILDPTAIISTEGGGPVQQSEQSFSIQKVEYYAPTQGKKSATNAASRLAVVFVLVMYVISFSWTDAAVKPIQLIQIALFHSTIESPIPPSVFYYLAEFKRTIFYFLPNFFSKFIDTETSYHSSSQKVVDLLVDYNFLRYMGVIFFFLIIFACMWVLFFFLSNRRLITHKTWHSMFEDVFKRRFKFMAINDVFSLFYVPILWFGLSQFKSLIDSGPETYMTVNAGLTVVFFVFAVVMPFVWLMMWIKFDPSRFDVECSFMCKRIKKMDLSMQIYEADEKAGSEKMHSEEKMKSEKFSEEPVIAQSSQIKNSKYQLETFITYIYLFLTTIWLVCLEKQVIAQLSLLMATNCLYILYILVLRPYINCINTVMTPLMVLPMLLLESYMVYFYMNDASLQSTAKTELAKPLIYILSALYMVMILWTVWRVIYDAMDVWNYFKRTEFYLEFGDPDHSVEKVESEDYEKFDKRVEQVNYQVGDQIVQKIYKTVNEKGDSVIVVRKKILKKKKKYEGRMKLVQKGQNYEDLGESSDSISENQRPNKKLEQSSQIDQKASEEDYIRVNQPTPFEMTKLIEQEQKAEREQKAKTKKNFKTIDDDIRDNDNDDEDYVPKSKPTKPKSFSKDEEEYYAKKNMIQNKGSKKVIMEIEDQEQSVHGIDDLLVDGEKQLYKAHGANEDMNGFAKSSRAAQKVELDKQEDDEQPFEFISDMDQDVPIERQKIEPEKVQLPIVSAKKENLKMANHWDDFLSEQLSSAKDAKEQSKPQQYAELQQSQNASELASQRPAQEQSNEPSIKKPEPTKDYKIFDLEELIQEEEQNKNKKLMFLFDEEDN